MIAAIRGADRRHIVFYEPHVLFNFGSDTNLPDFAPKRLGFSFHVYCLIGLVAGAPADCPRSRRASSSTTPTPTPERPATR